jgi:hypothetical protein
MIGAVEYGLALFRNISAAGIHSSFDLEEAREESDSSP